MSSEGPKTRLLIGAASAAGPVASFVGGRRVPRQHRPWVMTNLVASVDGATAISGASGGLSGPADREIFHQLRGVADAILVGAGTARADRYGPMRPHEGVQEARAARGQLPVAPIVIVSRSLGFDWSEPLFADAQIPTVVAAPTDAPERQLAAARRAGRVICAGVGSVALTPLLRQLADDGHQSVVCEGGPKLVADLAAHDLIDELFVTISPCIGAGDAQRMLAGPELVPARRLALVALLEADGAVFLRYEVMQ